jgi:hypothetical protein
MLTEGSALAGLRIGINDNKINSDRNIAEIFIKTHFLLQILMVFVGLIYAH